MILFTLRCTDDHRFEAWFRDGAAYESQAAGGAIVCPVCGDSHVNKAPMAPHLARHGTSDPATEPDRSPAPAAVRAVALALKRAVRDNCDYVGGRFADEARRIHYGETEARPIYGEASPGEARDLAEEGVAIRSVPWIDEGN